MTIPRGLCLVLAVVLCAVASVWLLQISIQAVAAILAVAIVGMVAGAWLAGQDHLTDALAARLLAHGAARRAYREAFEAAHSEQRKGLGL